MKIKILLTAILVSVLGGCTVPGYLPEAEQIGENQYGSYITVNGINDSVVKGELIEIDSTRLIVLVNTDSIKRAETLQTKEISRFTLLYAKPKKYGWTIPVYTLATFFHGLFLAFTAPINLIVTITVTSSGMQAFQYSEKEMTYEKLKMFARFPQGLPPGINIENIK